MWLVTVHVVGWSGYLGQHAKIKNDTLIGLKGKDGLNFPEYESFQITKMC